MRTTKVVSICLLFLFAFIQFGCKDSISEVQGNNETSQAVQQAKSASGGVVKNVAPTGDGVIPAIDMGKYCGDYNFYDQPVRYLNGKYSATVYACAWFAYTGQNYTYTDMKNFRFHFKYYSSDTQIVSDSDVLVDASTITYKGTNDINKYNIFSYELTNIPSNTYKVQCWASLDYYSGVRWVELPTQTQNYVYLNGGPIAATVSATTWADAENAGLVSTNGSQFYKCTISGNVSSNLTYTWSISGDGSSSIAVPCYWDSGINTWRPDNSVLYRSVHSFLITGTAQITCVVTDGSGATVTSNTITVQATN